MLAIVLAILPVFLLIALGAALRRWRFPGDGFWGPAERLTYFLLFPVLLITTLAGVDLGELEVAPMATALVVALLVMSLLVLALRPLLGLDGPGFTSAYQGAIRFNTYIGLAVAFGVHGTAGLAAAALALAVLVPTGNLLSIAVLARYAGRTPPTWGRVLKALARNPLVLSCLVGIALNATGLRPPPVLADMMAILGRAALPLGLLAVGAGLDFAAARAARRPIAVIAALKLLLLPGFTAAACWALGLGGVAAFTAVLFSALPAAPSAYVLARLLGGDAGLMAGLITAQTALALVTLPLVLVLLA